MLVGHRAVEIGPIEHGTAVAHGQGQRHALVHVHVPEIDRHREGCRLRRRNGAIGKAGNEGGNCIGRERQAIAFAGDDVLWKHCHDQSIGQISNAENSRRSELSIFC
ncbi:hypothetical protein FQZ97_1187410 [compost metagenome]